jgi:hypothetical protein
MALYARNNHVEYLLKKSDNNISSKEPRFKIIIPEQYEVFILIADAKSENFKKFQSLYKTQKIGMPLNPEIYYVDLNESELKEIIYGDMKFILSKEGSIKIK